MISDWDSSCDEEVKECNMLRVKFPRGLFPKNQMHIHKPSPNLKISELKRKICKELRGHSIFMKEDLMKICVSKGSNTFFRDNDTLKDILGKLPFGKNHHRVSIVLNDSIQVNLFNEKMIWTELRMDTTAMQVIHSLNMEDFK